MMTGLSIGFWDYLLIAVVSIHGTAIAYLPSPKAKAWLLCLPTTFSLSFLALGRPLEVANVLGLVLLLLFTHGVRVLYLRLRLPIIPAIVVSALGYCLAGSLLVPLLPAGSWAFWISCIAVFLLGIVLLCLGDRVSHADSDHQSPLPMAVKFPIIVVVILLLLLVKNHLQGFITSFPMVGVVAAYEGRYCLRTISRQVPIIMLLCLSMMIAIYVTQSQIGMFLSLILGWLVFLVVMLIWGFLFGKLDRSMVQALSRDTGPDCVGNDGVADTLLDIVTLRDFRFEGTDLSIKEKKGKINLCTRSNTPTRSAIGGRLYRWVTATLGEWAIWIVGMV